MKKILIFVFLAAVLSLVTSCNNDVLNKEPLGMISDNVVWADETLVNAYITEVYGEMDFFVNDLYGKSMYNTQFLGKNWFDMCMSTNISDEATDGWVAASFRNGPLTNAGGLFELWPYDLIRKQNVFLEQMAKSDLSANFKKQRIAEVRFLRAYTYFSMVKRYGGVPLITKSQSLTDSEADLYPVRNKEVEIYNFVSSEIDDIINDLPDSYSTSDLGRPTRYAALALKSRSAMFAASIATWGKMDLNGVVGIPATQAQSFWQASYDASNKIIQSGKYALYKKYWSTDKAKNYQYIFLDENNVEIIFSKQFNGNDGVGGIGHGWDLYQSPKAGNPWGGGNESAVYYSMVQSYDYIDGTPGTTMAPDLLTRNWTMGELWKNKDPRFFASIYTQGTPWQNDSLQMYFAILDANLVQVSSGSYNGILAKGASNASIFSFGVKKYLDPSVKTTPDNNMSTTDWIVFRYGEIVLNFAEAALELGKNAEALGAINQIRDRAGIALLSSISRDQIRNERKVELAFENHRYWDLRRWRTAQVALSGNQYAFRYLLDYNTRKFRVRTPLGYGTVLPKFSENQYYFPITRARIANNPNLVENPGY
ncbi:MAG: RagB/SusD family nutrient uptake outer membrane protein [Prolixibacteraceae bacterium]